MDDQAQGKILVVDDEIELMKVLVAALEVHGYKAIGCTCAKEALSALRADNFDLMITDLMMPDMNGIGLMQASVEIDPHLIAIVMTGHGTIETAVDAMKLGAFDYVLKPFRLQTLIPVLTRAFGARPLKRENL